jgi:hypothetical protein
VKAASSQNFDEQSADKYILTIDIIEHRSFFTLGNWNASTRLRIRIAEAVSQGAYDIATADMMSSLSQVSIK